jgi:4-diphosphocytidyl-2-C-methyl-D-erythritol kinase
MTRVSIAAPAKLNLGLEILGRRSDGYHEIRTVLQTVSILDHLTLRPTHRVEVSPPLPNVSDRENLATRAARLLQVRGGASAGVTIAIDKRIPAAAGLGGASSDAAATLRAANALWVLNWDIQQLVPLAAEIGSDVPFFLSGGTALATGRGDQLQYLDPLRATWFVVAVPRLAIIGKTAAMYGLLRLRDFSDGVIVSSTAASLDTGGAIQFEALRNAFTRPLYDTFPDLRDLGDQFRAAGAPVVAITGAGPAHFTVVDDPDRASLISRNLERRLSTSAEIILCRPISFAPAPESGPLVRGREPD